MRYGVIQNQCNLTFVRGIRQLCVATVPPADLFNHICSVSRLLAAVDLQRLEYAGRLGLRNTSYLTPKTNASASSKQALRVFSIKSALVPSCAIQDVLRTAESHSSVRQEVVYSQKGGITKCDSQGRLARTLSITLRSSSVARNTHME